MSLFLRRTLQKRRYPGKKEPGRMVSWRERERRTILAKWIWKFWIDNRHFLISLTGCPFPFQIAELSWKNANNGIRKWRYGMWDGINTTKLVLYHWKRTSCICNSAGWTRRWTLICHGTPFTVHHYAHCTVCVTLQRKKRAMKAVFA